MEATPEITYKRSALLNCYDPFEPTYVQESLEASAPHSLAHLIFGDKRSPEVPMDSFTAMYQREGMLQWH